ncbi:conjugal transfer protein [Streptomyces halstedii]|uniref:Conjugal transfer protein n=1 Tax=Streptomyces halstedii TaxID=1944 RepID=A0ABS6U0S8_STRHA|nr:conjugal transfer protein [Streptomyces halstedii]MBV7674148.1 conjugal transfer protein [Streptomyces halstedii]
MKAAWGRRSPKEVPALAEADGAYEDWAIDEGPQEVAGWSTGAQANTAAVIRWAAWGLLLLGPLLGAAAFLSVPAKAGPAPTASAATAPSAAGAQGAAGYAELFVAAYLEAGEGDQAALAAYYPGASGLRLEGTPGRVRGEQLAVVRLRQAGHGIWSVTVAARVTAKASPSSKASAESQSGGDGQGAAAAAVSTVRYFQVPVATTTATVTLANPATTPAPAAAGYTALAMPAEVGAPAQIKAPALVYGPMRPALPSDPRTQAVTEFLSAYLTGAGELDRYLAPGTKLTAITPAPYTGIAVDTLAIEGEKGSEPVTAVPGDGTRLRLLAAVRATGHDDVRLPLTYALTLMARAGRWEIASLDGAPASAAPSPATPSAITP